jgi:hypothetical protein
MGTKSRESIYGSSIRASAERAAAARKEADKLACGAWSQRMLGYKDRHSHRRRWATRSTPDFFISKSAASAATRTRPLPWTSCDGLSPRRSMNWNATCAARTALRCAAIRTSAAIWSRRGQRRFQRAIRPRRGGRENGRCEDGRPLITDAPTLSCDSPMLRQRDDSPSREAKMIRTNHARAYGALCMAGATLPLATHLNFAAWETILVGFLVGLGAFLLTAIVP